MFKTKGVRNNLNDDFQEDDIEKSLAKGDEFFTKTSTTTTTFQKNQNKTDILDPFDEDCLNPFHLKQFEQKANDFLGDLFGFTREELNSLETSSNTNSKNESMKVNGGVQNDVQILNQDQEQNQTETTNLNQDLDLGGDFFSENNENFIQNKTVSSNSQSFSLTNSKNSKEEKIQKQEHQKDLILKEIYEEHEIIVNKVIYIDDYSGFSIFTASPKSKRKPVFSTYNGITEEQYNFTVKIADKEATFLIKPENKLIVVGEWIMDDHYGLQFSAVDVSPVLLEKDKDILTFLEKGGLKKNITKDIAKALKFEVEAKEMSIKTLLENPVLLKKVPLIKELMNADHFLHRNIAFEWYHYKQAYYFGEKMSKYGLKMGKANKIYNWIMYPQPKKDSLLEISNSAPSERFEGAMDLNKTKDSDFENLDPYFFNKIYDFFMQNPYRYIDVHGIGFKTIDEVALKLGIEEHDERRIEAIITYSIQEECYKTKNTVVLASDVLSKITSMKGLTKEDATRIFNEYHKKKKVFSRKMDLGFGEQKYITTDQFFMADFVTGKKIDLLRNSHVNVDKRAIEEINSEDFNNDKSQSLAVKNSYTHPVSIITGGPGRGKTTTIKKLIYILQKYEEDKKIILLAPTGVAAKRMDKAIRFGVGTENINKNTLRKASTIHKFLFECGELGKSFGKQKSQNQNLQYDKDGTFNNHTFIIDESSMIDSLLMYHLIKLIGVGSRIVFVGDIDQIPPVGIGQVMRDLMEIKNQDQDVEQENEKKSDIAISKLLFAHRVGKESKIPEIAEQINQGKLPKEVNDEFNLENDFNFIKTDNDHELIFKMEDVVKALLDDGFKEEQIQIISPQWGGVVGVNELNKLFKWILNPLEDRNKHQENYAFKTPTKGMPSFINGDRIINNKNNYELDIFNGEMGIVSDKNENYFNFNRLDEKSVIIEPKIEKAFGLAYAITVHKSQGTESPVIIFPLSRSHSFNLDKFLLYTGVTRAKNKIFIIGDLSTFIGTVNKNKQGKRLTSLAYEMKHWQSHQPIYDFLMQSDDFIIASSDEDAVLGI